MNSRRRGVAGDVRESPGLEELNETPTPAGPDNDDNAHAGSIRRGMLRVARLRALLEQRRSDGDQADDFRVCFGIQSVQSARSVTLGDLLNDVGRVKDVPRERIPGLLLQLAALETALAGRLEELTARYEPMAVEPKDRLLTPDEAAALLGVTPASLRRNWRRYRFARKLSRKTLRFSETGLRRWIAAKVPS
jgi:hypothetical protein